MSFDVCEYLSTYRSFAAFHENKNIIICVFLSSSLTQCNPCKCDRIWQNFAALTKLENSSAVFVCGQWPKDLLPNYLSCCCSSSCYSGLLVNVLLGCTSGLNLAAYQGPVLALFEVKFNIWQGFEPTLGKVLHNLGIFHCCKWPNIKE